MHRIIRIASVAALAVALHGCSGLPYRDVVIGTPRAPISEKEVTEYVTAPPTYDEIAIIHASSKISVAITEQGHVNAAIASLKRTAAKYGANGILIREIVGQTEMIPDPFYVAPPPPPPPPPAFNADGTLDTSLPPPPPQASTPPMVAHEYKRAEAIAIWVKK
jgi:hypothetical protein